MSTIRRIRGDTWRIPFVINNGWTASMFSTILFTVYADDYPLETVTDDSGAIFQLSLAAGDIVIDSGDDTLGTVNVPASLTKPLATDREYVWDIQVTRDSIVPQQVYTLVRGTLVIDNDATRSTP